MSLRKRNPSRRMAAAPLALLSVWGVSGCRELMPTKLSESKYSTAKSQEDLLAPIDLTLNIPEVYVYRAAGQSSGYVVSVINSETSAKVDEIKRIPSSAPEQKAQSEAIIASRKISLPSFKRRSFPVNVVVSFLGQDGKSQYSCSVERVDYSKSDLTMSCTEEGANFANCRTSDEPTAAGKSNVFTFVSYNVDYLTKPDNIPFMERTDAFADADWTDYSEKGSNGTEAGWRSRFDNISLAIAGGGRFMSDGSTMGLDVVMLQSIRKRASDRQDDVNPDNDTTPLGEIRKRLLATKRFNGASFKYMAWGKQRAETADRMAPPFTTAILSNHPIVEQGVVSLETQGTAFCEQFRSTPATFRSCWRLASDQQWVVINLTGKDALTNENITSKVKIYNLYVDIKHFSKQYEMLRPKLVEAIAGAVRQDINESLKAGMKVVVAGNLYQPFDGKELSTKLLTTATESEVRGDKASQDPSNKKLYSLWGEFDSKRTFERCTSYVDLDISQGSIGTCSDNVFISDGLLNAVGARFLDGHFRVVKSYKSSLADALGRPYPFAALNPGKESDVGLLRADGLPLEWQYLVNCPKSLAQADDVGVSKNPASIFLNDTSTTDKVLYGSTYSSMGCNIVAANMKPTATTPLTGYLASYRGAKAGLQDASNYDAATARSNYPLNTGSLDDITTNRPQFQNRLQLFVPNGAGKKAQRVGVGYSSHLPLSFDLALPYSQRDQDSTLGACQSSAMTTEGVSGTQLMIPNLNCDGLERRVNANTQSFLEWQRDLYGVSSLSNRCYTYRPASPGDSVNSASVLPNYVFKTMQPTFKTFEKARLINASSPPPMTAADNDFFNQADGAAVIPMYRIWMADLPSDASNVTVNGVAPNQSIVANGSFNRDTTYALNAMAWPITWSPFYAAGALTTLSTAADSSTSKNRRWVKSLVFKPVMESGYPWLILNSSTDLNAPTCTEMRNGNNIDPVGLCGLAPFAP